MRSFLDLTKDEQSTLITKTSELMKISPLLIEKDFWVTWTLNALFASNSYAHNLTFKGGTSLSKAFGYIQRFSEDIDVTIDKGKLGYDPQKLASRKQRDRQILVLKEKAVDYVDNTIVPHLRQVVKNTVSSNAEWEIEKDLNDPLNIRFHYPSLINLPESSYIKQSILIEFGIRGEIEPHDTKTISSYVQEKFEDIVKEARTPIRVLSPVRTFWEKVTLIHTENHRPPHKPIPDRLSRHYYDVFQLISQGVEKKAIKDIPLLLDVIQQKSIFFQSSWSSYGTALPNTISLCPNERLQRDLESDYKMTQQMIFGKAPPFEEILQRIQKLEETLHRL
jgi:predicted nucleotidyltransferase component of viral defense system